jgi:hypothetical protein
MADTITGANDDAVQVRPGAPARFSWSATIVSAVIAVVVTIVLLLLGSGLGLALTPSTGTGQGAAPVFITLGAVYFLAAEAFGMAVGGHAVGRMIGPHIETANEENFRAGAHGLAVWAFAVLITLGLVVATGSIAEKSAIRLSALYGETAFAPPGKPVSIDYLVDLLFRPQGQDNRHASLDGVQFAQVVTQTATDAAPASPQSPPVSGSPPQQEPPMSSGIEVPGGQSTLPMTPPEQPQPFGSETAPSHGARHVPGDLMPAPPPATAPNPTQLASDKTEAMHVLEAASLDGAAISVDDRDRIALLVAQDANMSYEAATARVNEVLAKLRDTHAASLNAAKRIAGFSALWLAASFIFGAIVSVVAAISARWEDDMQTMFAVVRMRRR